MRGSCTGSKTGWTVKDDGMSELGNKNVRMRMSLGRKKDEEGW